MRDGCHVRIERTYVQQNWWYCKQSRNQGTQQAKFVTSHGFYQQNLEVTNPPPSALPGAAWWALPKPKPLAPWWSPKKSCRTAAFVLPCPCGQVARARVAKYGRRILDVHEGCSVYAVTSCHFFRHTIFPRLPPKKKLMVLCVYLFMTPKNASTKVTLLFLTYGAWFKGSS